MCKSDKSKLDFKDYVSSKITGNELHENKLRVYKLLDGLIWPMFLIVKQKAVKDDNLYFCRMTPADIKRRELTLQLLKTGMSPVWIGFPGIGKSADMNYILMELLTHIGEVDWPSIVAFRFDGKIAEFRYDSSRSLTTISWYHGSAGEILNYSERIHKLRVSAALVVELGEDEADPKSYIPMTIAISSRDVNTVLKTLYKTGSYRYMLVSPPTVDELQVMVQAELDLNQQITFFEELTIDEAKAEVKRRSDIVGPIPRFVLASKSTFDDRKNSVDAIRASQFFSQLTNLDYNNVPEGVKLCVAPFLKYGVENPQSALNYGDAASPKIQNTLSPSEQGSFIYEFKFLSDYIALNIAKQETNDNKEIEAMKLYHLDYLLAEAVIKYGVLEASMRPKVFSEFWDTSHWEWHADPGYQSLLDTTTEITSTTTSSIPSIPPCSREINFSGVYLKMPAKDLEAGVLYRSLSLSMAIGEFLTVDHATKTVFMFQVTLSDIKDHPFKESTIENVMTSLNMINTNDSESSQYSLHLLCFADWSKVETHGSKISVKSISQSTLDLSRIKSNIIRACIWPARSKFNLLKKEELLKTNQSPPLTDPRLCEENKQTINLQTPPSTLAIDRQTPPSTLAIDPQTPPSTLALDRQTPPSTLAIDPQTPPSTLALDRQTPPSTLAIDPQTPPSTLAIDPQTPPSTLVIDPQTPPSTLAIDPQTPKRKKAIKKSDKKKGKSTG